jgi:predicted TIM-barrel fold metal-dependent hydrolase
VTDLAEFTATLPLVDHHCHGLVRGEVDRPGFESLCTESDWPASPYATPFDSPLGVFIRAECAAGLGLPRHCDAESYITRRAELGSRAVAAILMAETGISDFVVDTGFSHGIVMEPQALADIVGSRAHEIVRLESVAEAIAPDCSASNFADVFRAAVAERIERAVGFKSIIAYRYGLDFDPGEPTSTEVARAAGEWLSACEGSGQFRLDHPVLLRLCLWEAVRHRKPIQFHVGYGDADIQLNRCDPSLMTEFIRATVDSGASIMLLHCYPYIREAGILAQVFPHVWMDTGLAVSHTGASASRLVRESLEIAPFGKLLFSSDAFGLPELFVSGTRLWRRAMVTIMEEWVATDSMGLADAKRYVSNIGAENARRIYGLGGLT